MTASKWYLYSIAMKMKWNARIQYFTVTYMMIWERLFFIKINERNTLFTNYNNHDKFCFLFNNTDSHISKLLLISFFKHLKDERNIIILIIPFNYICISLALSEDDLNCGITNFKWRYDHRSGNCNLSNCKAGWPAWKKISGLLRDPPR